MPWRLLDGCFFDGRFFDRHIFVYSVEYVWSKRCPSKKRPLKKHLLFHFDCTILNLSFHFRIFKFPPFFEKGPALLTAKFDNIIEVFNSELHQPVKMAHKLSHRVLHPGPNLITLFQPNPMLHAISDIFIVKNATCDHNFKIWLL